MIKSKKYISIIKITVTLGLLFIIVERLDLNKFYEISKGIDVNYLVIPVLLWIVSVYLSAYKWNTILANYNVKITNTQAFMLYLKGSFFNNFLPSSFGGDGYKFYALHQKQKGNKSRIIFSLIQERGIGLFASMVTALIFGGLFLDKIMSDNLLTIIYIGIFFCMTVFMLFLVVLSRKRKISLRSNNKIVKKLEVLANVFLSLYGKRKVLIKSILVSLILTFVNSYSLYYLFVALNYNLPIQVLLFVVPFVQLSDIVPITLNSVGLREGWAMYVFQMFGVVPELVLSVYVVSRILSFFCTSTGGFIYLFQKSKSEI